jgi:alpha-glucosidase (family GH31 glycosyl hydrolase)
MSRDGWVIVVDHDNHVINSNDWWAGVNSDDIDIYFFGHGQRYTDALKDYTLVGGKIAMVPKYMTGIWW